MGYTQLLQLSPHLDAQERDHVNAVLAGSRHLLNLINDLLQITSDELHNLPIKPQPVNLGELALRCTTLMQPLMVEKQLTLHNRMSAEHWVMADSLRAQQCIINVLANAIKYSASNTAITLEVSTHGQRVRLSIRDQGPGIAAEVGQQVFEPFYRVQDTLTGVDGAGIGLAVVQRLVENMNGHISYESTLGVGTVFHLDLPPAQAPATHKKTPSSPARIETNATKLVANSSESIS
jgi:signal transduction histidine kinase